MFTVSTRRGAAIVGTALFAGLAVAACGSSTDNAKDGSSPAAKPHSSSAAEKPAKKKDSPKPAPQVLLSQDGSGIHKTQQFKTGGNWTLKYSFDCSNFGSQGNFSVTEFTDGQLTDVLVNELKTNGNGSDPVYDAGTHYLEINSECDWHVTVTG